MELPPYCTKPFNYIAGRNKTFKLDEVLLVEAATELPLNEWQKYTQHFQETEKSMWDLDITVEAHKENFVINTNISSRRSPDLSDG